MHPDLALAIRHSGAALPHFNGKDICSQPGPGNSCALCRLFPVWPPLHSTLVHTIGLLRPNQYRSHKQVSATRTPAFSVEANFKLTLNVKG